ncbi:transcriptional regulator, LacI family [Cellulophaga fucicola]|uniref:Transcriptional regulator, LacI family n=2 Tax=Cellulophaga fucicola TaxID=76595 RepID=A0A1K1NPE5_9FLAO|nr:transcriptional regulator, LacI family [Cellulophaga fucicola]
MGTKRKKRAKIMIQTRPTLSQMSKALDLSISTVSKSLSDSPEISISTKNKVREFARKCNYRPNSFAASLRRGYTKNIGLIIPSVLNPFYAKVLVGVEKYLDENGYKLITSISNESAEKEAKYLSVLGSGYVDGVIICVSKETEITNKYKHIDTLIGQGTPLVLFDRISDLKRCDSVRIDDYKASFEATEYLIVNKDCKKPIMVSLINQLQHGKLRAKGFTDALKKYNISTENSIIDATTIEELISKVKPVLQENNIDGIFGANDLALAQTMDIERNLNTIKIAYTGFCNNSKIAWNPALRIINQNAKKMGEEAAKLVIQRIKITNTTEFYTRTIRTEFV